MHRSVWLSLVGLWMAGIWYLSDQPQLATDLSYDRLLRVVAHALEFGGLTFLLVKTVDPRGSSPRALLLAAGVAFVYAVVDEWHQSWVPGRVASVADIVVDTAGIIFVTLWLWWWGRRSELRQQQP